MKILKEKQKEPFEKQNKNTETEKKVYIEIILQDKKNQNYSISIIGNIQSNKKNQTNRNWAWFISFILVVLFNKILLC